MYFAQTNYRTIGCGDTPPAKKKKASAAKRTLLRKMKLNYIITPQGGWRRYWTLPALDEKQIFPCTLCELSGQLLKLF